jgi:hypothetical protein
LAIALRPIVSEVDFYLRDNEALGRSIVEWAFLHLRRRLTVEETLRTSWTDAFSKGEPQVEKLGAIHLLGHGIYAFKTSGAGAATDLILALFSLPPLPTRSRYARWMRNVKMQLGTYSLCSRIMGAALFLVACASSPPGVVFGKPYACAADGGTDADVDASVSATLTCAVGTSFCSVNFQDNGA